MAKDYRAYFFDWDGTLAKTVEIWLAALERLFNDYGLPATREQIAHNFGNWKSPLLYGLPESEFDAFNEKLVADVHEKLPDAPLYEEAASMLERLAKAGKRLVLITSSQRESIDIVMKRHSVAEHFDLIITSDDVAEHKPHPESILLALNKLQINPEDAVMIGDTDKDMGAAQRAGVDRILFYPESHAQLYDLAHLKTFQPARVIRSWEEL